MTKKTIKELSDSSLWLLLSDIAGVISDNRHIHNIELSDFLIQKSNEIKDEIDRRLFKDF